MGPHDGPGCHRFWIEPTWVADDDRGNPIAVLDLQLHRIIPAAENGGRAVELQVHGLPAAEVSDISEAFDGGDLGGIEHRFFPSIEGARKMAEVLLVAADFAATMGRCSIPPA